MIELKVRAVSEAVGLRRETILDAAGLPLWLARLHQSLPVGDLVKFSMTGSPSVPFELLLEGAGFGQDNGDLVRLETLPDIVGPEMRLLVCGLNPSPHAASSGVGFSRPGNRFWPAALATGMVTTDRDPTRALLENGVGFTDLVKRTTVKADELTSKEYQAGLSRLERLVSWLEPTALVMVGLTGWRQATHSKATAGWQPDGLGTTPVYLMPNTSGLNAHETHESLAEHLRLAQVGPPLADLVG